MTQPSPERLEPPAADDGRSVADGLRESGLQCRPGERAQFPSSRSWPFRPQANTRVLGSGTPASTDAVSHRLDATHPLLANSEEAGHATR